MSGHSEFWKHDISRVIDIESSKMLIEWNIGELEPALVQIDARKVGNWRHDRHINERKQVTHPLQDEISLERANRIGEKCRIDQHPKPPRTGPADQSEV